MKARYPGTCPLCYKAWHKDALVARWLSKLVHQGCRDQEAARIQTEGSVRTLPDARGYADAKKLVTSTRIRRDRKARITL